MFKEKRGKGSGFPAFAASSRKSKNQPIQYTNGIQQIINGSALFRPWILSLLTCRIMRRQVWVTDMYSLVLHFEPFASNLEAIHLLYCGFCGDYGIVGNKA
jgi:hypothetical protein